MNATEKDNVFYCDCGFSWRRGMSGSHNCEDGLRAKLTDMAVQLANAESKCMELADRAPTPVTYSENSDADRCRKWAWEKVKGELSTEDWTTGDNINYFGFFCWGWDMRRQYNEQRTLGISLKGE